MERTSSSASMTPPPRTFPRSVGIEPSTCEVTTALNNRAKLPIPPPQAPIANTPLNPQLQSIFFKLPAEIRVLVYEALLGHRRIHIDHDHCHSPWEVDIMKMRPEDLECEPELRWRWFHFLCPMSDTFNHDECFDPCPKSNYDMSYTLRVSGPAIFRNILQGIAWLRCCRLGYYEALRIVYGTNVFAMDTLDTPFRISRMFPARHLSLIKALDVTFLVLMVNATPPDFNNGWEATYPAMFATLQSSFPNVCKLRVSIALEPFGTRRHTISADDLDRFLGPWEGLVASRDWKRIELRVPDSWHLALKSRVESRGCRLGRIDEVFPHIFGWC